MFIIIIVVLSPFYRKHTRLRAFKEAACGHNMHSPSEDSSPHRQTPELPGQ